MHLGRLLPFEKLSKAKDGVERGAQFMTHAREKFALGFACSLYLVNPLAVGDVLDCALVVNHNPIRISNGAGILGEPNPAAVLAINFILEPLDEALRFDQTPELVAAIGINVDDVTDVTNAFRELFG